MECSFLQFIIILTGEIVNQMWRQKRRNSWQKTTRQKKLFMHMEGSLSLSTCQCRPYWKMATILNFGVAYELYQRSNPQAVCANFGASFQKWRIITVICSVISFIPWLSSSTRCWDPKLAIAVVFQYRRIARIDLRWLEWKSSVDTDVVSCLIVSDTATMKMLWPIWRSTQNNTNSHVALGRLSDAKCLYDYYRILYFSLDGIKNCIVT